MDKQKRDLEALVNSQKEQLNRYETRLKDVVAAYKGLLKEKEALEASLAAISKDPQPSPAKSTASEAESSIADDAQTQIATLMNSLATLSAEKSRQEASFQADRKLLRQEIANKDKLVRELHERLEKAVAKSNAEAENYKSKLIVEKHERDKEHNDHMIMVNELQKILGQERHLRESLEMQLDSLKSQIVGASAPSEDEGRFKELLAELEEARRKIEQYESQRNASQEDTSSVFQQLQSEMALMQKQHHTAIRNEQLRAQLAEENAKRLSALHEERVASLEARLSELSETVGTYDRLRKHDQDSIQKLKDKLAQLSAKHSSESQSKQFESLGEIVEEILRLKKLLSLENAKTDKPIDLGKIFASSMPDVDSGVSPTEYSHLKAECERLRDDNDAIKFSFEEQKVHIKTLQEKIKVLNRNIDEHENEVKRKQQEYLAELKTERNKWRSTMAALENDYRAKIAQMETELQKQRERSLLLLEEKEKEIKTLKTSFEVLIPGNVAAREEAEGKDPMQQVSKLEKRISATHLGNVLETNGGLHSGDSHLPLLHYAHELARKDVEISNLRKAKHSAETSLRQVLQDKVTVQEQLHEKIGNLEDEVDRLNRYKSREGANLEYLKNVILSYLTSKDPEGKKHMLNAIGTVLKFSDKEMNSISIYFSHSGKKK